MDVSDHVKPKNETNGGDGSLGFELVRSLRSMKWAVSL